MDLDLQNSVPPVPWELTRKPDRVFEPAVTMAPWVQVFEGSALQRSTTLGSSGSTCSSEVLSSSVSLAESAQSIPFDTEMGEVSREDASLRAPKSEPKTAEDGGVSSVLNTALSPADEKGEWLKSEGVDQMRENVDLDASLSQEQSLDESRSSTPDSISSGVLNSEETSMSQLDDLLQLDAREFVGDEGTAFDSLFSGSLGQDFFTPESVGDWAIDCFPEFPSLHLSQQIPEVQNHELTDQDVSHKWFQNYLHRFSLSDLRKIKLKKSTIEIATRRLGGGKKGMLCFLKLVLVWLLNQNAKRMHSDSSESGKLPTGDFDKYFANEHVAGFSASVEDKSANCSNRILAAQVLQDGSPTQEQVLSRSALRRNEEDIGVAFAGSSSHCTRLSNPVVGMRNMHEESGLGSVRSLYTPNFPHSTDPNENNWSSLQPFNNTKYMWSPRDGDGGATTSPDASDFSGSPFPAMLPQGMNGESEWHGYCGSTLHETNLQPSPGTGVVSSSFGTYNPSTSDSMGLTPNTSAAATRAARISRMERRKWSVRRQQRWTPKLPPGNLQWPYQMSRASPTNNLPYSPRSGQRLARSSVETQQVKKSERNLRLLFQKELKQSDVGNLGRIVLPKKAAETSLPPIDLRDGVNLVVEDLNSSKVWNMRYRFWPNNKSRMYLLENTGDFVKSYNLKEGDYMILYINISNNKYMIRGDKGKPANAAAVSENAYSDLSTSNGYGVLKNYRTESGLTNLVGSYHVDQPDRHQVPKASRGITITSAEACGGSEVELDDFFIAELEQSLEDIDDT